MAYLRAQIDYRQAADGPVDRIHSNTRVRPVAVPALVSDHRDADPSVGPTLGADLHELLSRIDAVLRQLDAPPAKPSRDSARGCFRFCGWQLDTRARRLSDPAGAPVTLTKAEYTLLRVFINSPGRPLTRGYLLQATRLHEDVSDRSIDVQVLRLRRKLERGEGAARVIQTERGVGYVFTGPVERI